MEYHGFFNHPIRILTKKNVTYTRGKINNDYKQTVFNDNGVSKHYIL